MLIIIYLIVILSSGITAFILGYDRKRKEIEEYNLRMLKYYENYVYKDLGD